MLFLSTLRAVRLIYTGDLMLLLLLLLLDLAKVECLAERKDDDDELFRVSRNDVSQTEQQQSPL